MDDILTKPRKVEQLSILLCLVVVFFFSNFNFPPQVIEFIDKFNLAWNEGELHVHPHVIRFLMLLPQILLSEFFGVTYNEAFTIFAPFIVLFTLYMIRGCIYDVTINKTAAFLIAASLISVCILFANGRVLFAFLSTALLLKSTLEYLCGRKVKPVYIVLSLFLSSISSGVSIVVFCGFLAITLLPPLEGRDSSKSKIRLCLFLFAPVNFMWLAKNALFFFEDKPFIEGIQLLLAHGYYYKPSFSLTLLMGVLVIVLFVLLLQYRRRLYYLLIGINKKYAALIVLTSAFILGGFFGKFTLLAGLPVFIVAMLVIFERACGPVRALYD